MFFLNLSLPEFLALLGSVSGIAVALYLLDRARRKQAVATLRFFSSAASAPQHAHRHRVQQPLSLLLQLLSMALLLLALAQLRCGVPEQAARRHVLILDTSAWMNSEWQGGTRLIGRARSLARAYLDSLPPTDRVMLVRADALATPVTGFTSDRKALDRAIDASQPGASVLNIGQALSFAEEAGRIEAGAPGEIVFVGAGRIDAEVEAGLATPANLRIIPVRSPVPLANCGLRKVTVRRAEDRADQWDVFASVRNYGGEPARVAIVTMFDGAPSGAQALRLPPGGEQDATFTQSTKTAGILDVRLTPGDGFPQDNRAVLELPAPVVLPVTVYTDDPASLRPLLGAIPSVEARFVPVAQYSPAAGDARIVILDGFAPTAPPAVNAIWIAPPAGGSPIPVAKEEDRVKLTRWNAASPLTAGIRSRDLDVEHTLVFRAGPGDIPIAGSADGPLIVARDGAHKLAVLGFQPERSALRYQLATPLFFANTLRWMAPQVFRRVELSAAPAGSVSVQLASNLQPDAVRVTGEQGRALPFTLDGRDLRFFAGQPGVARVSAGDQELDYSLTLPSAGDAWWEPSNARRGIPARLPLAPKARDLWPWLALLGCAGLLADWLLYGPSARRRAAPARSAAKRPALRKAS